MAHQAYFGVKLGDHDKLFAPYICCKTCVEELQDCSNKKSKSIPFDIPMVRREGRDHVIDCYFCMTNLKSFYRKNKLNVQYPDSSSVINPVLHGPDLPVPEPNVTIEYSSNFESINMTDTAEYGVYRPEVDDQLPLTQTKLNDLTRDLNLTKGFARLQGSRLQQKPLLAPVTTLYRYHEFEREIRYLFTFDKASSLVYCNNIADLIELLGLKYDAME